MSHITHRFRGAHLTYLGHSYEALPLGAHGAHELIWLRRCDSGMSWGVMAWDGAELLTACTECDMLPVRGLPLPLRTALVDALTAANPPLPMTNEEVAGAAAAVQRDAVRQLHAAYTPLPSGALVLASPLVAGRQRLLDDSLSPEETLPAGTWLRYLEAHPDADNPGGPAQCYSFEAYVSERASWECYQSTLAPQTRP